MLHILLLYRSNSAGTQEDFCFSLNMRNSIEQLMFLATLLYLLCFSSMKALSSDMITKDQQIDDGQTLVSAGGIFELGFFSPENSMNRYVGIWYKKIPVQRLVWVANREKPVTDSTGVLMINNDGSLVIMDLKGNSILIGYGSGAGTNTSARLLDDGNLILREGDMDKNGRVLWQSFDYPTHTLLPGMKLGRNLKSKVNRLLTSWKSLEDPSPGNFSVGMDPNGTAQFFIWNEGVIYWTSGMFDGIIFSLIPEMRRSLIYRYSYVSNENEQYFTYAVDDSSVVSTLVLDFSGQIKQQSWLENGEDWYSSWSQPRDKCDVFSSCGVYGSCNPSNSPPCKCLTGFKPVSPKDWESNIWSGGCARSTNLKCGSSDGFLQLRRMKLPNKMLNVTGMGQDTKDCEAMCMKNCSCIAYAPKNKAGCLLWDKDLLGIQEDYGEEDLFIRLAAEELRKDKPSKGKYKTRLWVIAVVVVLALLLSGFFLFYLWRRKLKRRGAKREEEDRFFKELGTNIGPARKFNTANTYEGDTKDSDFQLFSFASIVAATNNFSAANKLGEGGFGPVYKAKLLDGREIAVKRLSIRSKQGLEEFKNEIVLIAKLQHTNLVRLFGCCIQTEEKMLIYEYMANRSLDSFLFDPTKRAILDWGKRVNIIEGIAQGILYLHRYSRFRVIHRDLKAGNILLDSDMNPKISDFGMARIFGTNESEANTNRVVGTYGYMSPEYAMKGIFSTKSDVFSFGVLLLEILSGKKSTSFNHSKCSLNLLGYAWELWKDGRGMELIDPILVNSVSAQDFMKCMNVGLLCVQESPIDRPTMQEVISMLTGGTGSVMPIPKQAAYFLSRRETETSISKSHPGTSSCSLNEITVSLMEAR